MAGVLVPGPGGDPINLRFDVSTIDKLGELIATAAKQVPKAVAQALNRTAFETRTAMKRALQHQTGASSAEVLKALRVSPANQYALSSAIIATGPYMSLSQFKARQTKPGVTAAPWGKRRLFKHAFIVGSIGGHVFVREGRARLPIHMLYGPAIPVEMGRPGSESVTTFYTTVPPVLAKRLEVELNRLLPATALATAAP